MNCYKCGKQTTIVKGADDNKYGDCGCRRKRIITTCLLLLSMMMTPAYSLTDANVMVNNSSTGGSTSVIVTFTITSETWPDNGEFRMTFPVGFDLSNVAMSDVEVVSGIDGSFVNTDSTGLDLITYRIGGNSINNGECKLRINNVINPTTQGSTGTFLISIVSPLKTIANGVVLFDSVSAVGGSRSGGSELCLVADEDEDEDWFFWFLVGFFVVVMLSKAKERRND